jgi:hypothetical protein
MAGHSDDRHLSEHIESISTRADRDTARLLAALIGKPSDRSEPGALDWVRRWGPRRVSFTPPPCSCSVGRCRVCN